MGWLRRSQSQHRHRREEQVLRAEERALVTETANFLSGRCLEHLSAEAGRAPAWAVVNAAAHGDLTRLERLATVTRNAPIAFGPSAAAGIIARELLERSGGDPAWLLLLQTEALVPLELRLIETCPRECLTEYEIVELARGQLDAVEN
jgi:hypothetical protein